MTADDYRNLALSLPHAVEKAHHGHPDFRVKNKIFATLGHPDESRAMVQLTPAQQRAYRKQFPDVFSPAAGAWGVKGSTIVQLEVADPETIREALSLAWRNVAPKGLHELLDDEG
jgi:hypothetical protein